MINKYHVYNFYILIFIVFSFLNCKINSKHKSSSYKYDYFNILDKGPKTDINYIFNENIDNNNNNNQNSNIEQYNKIVDETFPAYQSLFFTDLQTITPLYDQSIKCLFPIKKEISFNDDLYLNNNLFKNKSKIKIIPTDLAKILLKPLKNICYNYFIDKWYYKICPFNKAIQTLSFLRKNPKTGKEEKEINYLGYASNDTTDFNEIEYFYDESPYEKEFFENDIYKFFNKSQIVGTFQNVIKIYDSPDVQKEFKKINEENKGNEILVDYLIYKYQYKRLEIDYEVSKIEKIKDILKYKVNKDYKNLEEFKRNNKSHIITYEREIRKSINKNVFLLDEELPQVQSGIVNTRIKVYQYNQEDYYNKEFFVEKNLLYCEHCNLLKCQSNNCFLTLSKDKENYYKIIDFIDEKLVMIDSYIDKTISHRSKFALFINDEYIFFFGKGKIEEIKRLKELESNEKGDTKENNIFILKGKKLNLKEGDNILILLKQVKKGDYYIIKDVHNQRLYLLGSVNKKIDESQYEITISNINNSSYANSTILPVGEKFFKIEKRENIKEQKGNVQIINKSKDIVYNANIKNNLFNIYQLSQITMPRNNLNINIPYKIFDLNSENNQTVFHFVLKKMSQWKESYINICLSGNETCSENDLEIIIHSKKGILIHRPKLSNEKVINDTLLFHSNDVVNLFTEKIICDIILVNSSLYFNVIDYSDYSYIKIKYIFKKEEFNNIKYAIISPMKSSNIKIKGIYVTNIMSKKLIMNMYFYDKQYLLDDKAVFMETFTNGDYCEVVKKPRSVKVFYMCDESGINNLKIAKVHEAKTKLCEYIYYVKTRLLCNPNNIMRSQVNSSFSKSLCYSDKIID